MERRYVRQVLNAVGGNKTHAARILGIDRRSLYRRLEEPRNDRKEDAEAGRAELRDAADGTTTLRARRQSACRARRRRRCRRWRSQPGELE